MPPHTPRAPPPSPPRPRGIGTLTHRRNLQTERMASHIGNKLKIEADDGEYVGILRSIDSNNGRLSMDGGNYMALSSVNDKFSPHNFRAIID